jgi:hypothetical protein
MGRYSSVAILTRRGTKKSTPVRRDDGQPGGVRTEHWDGRVDVVVAPESVDLRVLKDGDS